MSLLHFRASFARPSSSKLSAAFLQLPPSCRAFHASPRPQFLETIVTPAHALFEGIHSFTGLPWAYSIPLTALTIRTFISLPLTWTTRKAIQKHRELDPLLHSWRHLLQKETMNEVGHLGPEKVNSTLAKKMKQKRNEIYARHNCGIWKIFLQGCQLPVFLTAIEALRKMAGAREGLLGLIVASISSSDTAAAATTAEPELAMTHWFEPDFATEGALWFQDLTVADPQMCLPFMLSGAMLLNLLGDNAARGSGKWQKRIHRTLLTMAVASGPLLLHVPSGVLVYWTSSMLIAYGQNLLLAKLLPPKEAILPCKPQVQLGVGRSMIDKLIPAGGNRRYGMFLYLDI
ncbi:Mitochondrial inner membrane protein COX18 [Lachnellula suecica]|uniref:Mitochondrial inner membrane protein COX18 n=1 Tax=Lachnellula suecica TaxID=602035 RepID=A0A8T9C876_9HELO|nr:Mitochondrial inner membrane protein COX18 [Lachnellula suecica]